MADLNKISAIGDVQAQLDADEATESLKQQEFTREELDAHASNLDINDRDLFDAIRAAKTEVDKYLIDVPEGNAAQRMNDLIRAIEDATGGSYQSEEGVWLAQKLGIADELQQDQNGEVVGAGPTKAQHDVETSGVAEAETAAEASADAGAETETESAAETTELTTGAQEPLKEQLTEAAEGIITSIEAAGETVPEEFKTFIEELGKAPITPAVKKIIENLDNLQDNMDWLKDNPTVMKAVMENSNFVSNLAGGQYATLDTFLTGLKSSLEEHPEEETAAAIVKNALEGLTAPTGTPDAAANSAIESGDAIALINGVPDSMQTMFASEYEAWSSAMRVPGATLVKFQDYLVAEAGGDEGKLSTIALKIQLAGFIEMLKPFIDMFKSLTGQVEEDPDAPTEEEQQVDAQGTAGINADRQSGIEDETELQRRADYRETANYLNNKGVVIKDAMGEDGKIDYELLMNLPVPTEIQNPMEIKAIVDQIKSKEWGAQVLAVGLSLKALNNLRNINVVDDVTVTGTSPNLMLNIGGEEVTKLSDEDNRDSAIIKAASAYIKSAPARLEAAEKARLNNLFMVAVRKKIVTSWNSGRYKDDAPDSVTVEAGENTGFVISNNRLILDLNDGGVLPDAYDHDVVLFTLDKSKPSDYGFANWDPEALIFLREKFGGKTIAAIRDNN